jgi:hypothetical protein
MGREIESRQVVDTLYAYKIQNKVRSQTWITKFIVPIASTNCFWTTACAHTFAGRVS